MPETSPLRDGSAEPMPDGLIEADRLLDRLLSAHEEQASAQHVEVFEVVHKALVDALAQTGS